MGPRAGLDRCKKISPPLGFNPRTVQPIASRYADYATRPTSVFMPSCLIKHRDNFYGIKDYCLGVRVLLEWWILADLLKFTNTERVNSQELYNLG